MNISSRIKQLTLHQICLAEMDETIKGQDIPRFSERSIRNLVGSEGGLQEASDRLGHASPATTKRYYRLKPTVVVPLSSQIK